MTDAKTPFAVAFESPGSQPTATPARVPSTELHATDLPSVEIPLNFLAGIVPCDATRRTEIPNRPVRRGMSSALPPPMECQLRKPYRKVNIPRIPDMPNSATAHPGDSLVTIIYPITETRTNPIPQSKRGWNAGRRK